MSHYEALGMERDATHAELRTAYLALARQWHPDLYDGPGRADAEARIRTINDAWAVLGSKHERRAYDAQLVEMEDEPTRTNASRRGRAHFAPFDDEPVRRVDLDDDPTPFGQAQPLPRALSMAPIGLVCCSAAIFLLGLLMNARAIIAVAAVAFAFGAIGFLALPLWVMSRAERDPKL